MSTVIVALVSCDRCGHTADPVPVGEIKDLELAPTPPDFEDVLGGDYCKGCVLACRAFLSQTGDEVPVAEPEPEGALGVLRYIEALALLKGQFAENEYNLCKHIAEHTGFVPDVWGIQEGSATVGARVSYWYLDASGVKRLRQVACAVGRPEEMLLHALRDAARCAQQDHVGGRTE